METINAECAGGVDASDDEVVFEESEEMEAFLPYEEDELPKPRKEKKLIEGEGVKNVEEALKTRQAGGSRGMCTVPACATKALARGLCVMHGGKRVCRHPGCPSSVRTRGL